MAENENMECAKIISIEEPQPGKESKNRYVASVAEINPDGNIEFWFNGPLRGKYKAKRPLLFAIAEILEEYRAYEIRWNIKTMKNAVSKYLDQGLERFDKESNNELNWIMAFDKGSDENETEKMMLKGIVPKDAGKLASRYADELSQKCSLLVMQMESSNMDDDALLIISSKKIGSRLKELLKKYGEKMPIIEGDFENFFDYQGVLRKIKSKG